MNRFERVFISLANCIDISFGVGLKFATVDAAFSKHSVYRDGFLHLLTTRDGMLILAVAICETESASTYEWFAANCKVAGIGRYLNKDAVIFSDQGSRLSTMHFARLWVAVLCTSSEETAGPISEDLEKPSRTRWLGYFRKLRLRRNTMSI